MRWGSPDGARHAGEPEKPLANELLFGSLVDGGSVKVELDKDKKQLTYHFLSAAKRKADEGAVH